MLSSYQRKKGRVHMMKKVISFLLALVMTAGLLVGGFAVRCAATELPPDTGVEETVPPTTEPGDPLIQPQGELPDPSVEDI